MALPGGPGAPPRPKPQPQPRPTVPVHDMPPPNAGGPRGGAGPTVPGQKLAPLTLPGAGAAAQSPGHSAVANFKDPRISRGPQDPKLASPANSIPAEIARRAQMYGIPANLALAVAHVESGFSQGAVSPAGAIGVMQLMPGTAGELGVDPYNWRQNIDGGVRYLAEKVKQYHGNVNEALQAYNGGDGNVGSAATQHYAQLVLGTRNQIKSGQIALPKGDRGFYTISSPLPTMNMVTPNAARVDASTGIGDFHNGVDLAAPEGTAVHAMIGGRVVINSNNPNGAGNYLVIRDPAGRDWYYMHLADRPGLKVGAKIGAGERIGAVGMTGLTTGPHLHVALKVPQLGIAEKMPAAKAALQYAATQLGTPYVWGGEIPKKGFDCSGLIQWAYEQIGVHLPRTTYDQVKVGKPVGLHDLKPGDLVFLEPGSNGPGHVVMYAGNGRVIVAPHTGTDVQYQRLSVALGDGFVAARRVLRAVDGPKAWADPTDILQKAGKVGWNHTARIYAPMAVAGGVTAANAPVSGAGGSSSGTSAGGGGADPRFGEDITPYASSPIDTNDVANDSLGQAQAPTNVFESLASSGPISPETAALMAQTVGQQPMLPAAIEPSGGPDSFLPPPPTG